VTVAPWNSSLIRRSRSGRTVPFRLSPIGFLGRFGRKGTERWFTQSSCANVMPKAEVHPGNVGFTKNGGLRILSAQGSISGRLLQSSATILASTIPHRRRCLPTFAEFASFLVCNHGCQPTILTTVSSIASTRMYHR
jgi:hypothetical protein